MTLEKERIITIIREYQEELKRIFGDQLEGVFLYGSFARDKAHNGSDVDVLVVLRSPFDYEEAIRKTSELTAKISLSHDIVISRVFYSADDIKNPNLPFYMNVRRERVTV